MNIFQFFYAEKIFFSLWNRKKQFSDKKISPQE